MDGDHSQERVLSKTRLDAPSRDPYTETKGRAPAPSSPRPPRSPDLDAALSIAETLHDQPAGRSGERRGRGRSRRAGRAGLVGVPTLEPARGAGNRGRGDDPEPDRRLRSERPARVGPVPLPRGRPPDLDPPRDARPDRPAPQPRGGRCLPGRRPAGRLRAAGRSPARQPPLRRALGTVLARPGPLCRLRRLRAGPAASRRLAIPRLGRPGAQRGHALRPVRPAPACRRRAGRPTNPGRRPRSGSFAMVRRSGTRRTNGSAWTSWTTSWRRRPPRFSP